MPFDAGLVASQSARLFSGLSARQDVAREAALEVEIAELADRRGRPRLFLRARRVATSGHFPKKP